MYLVRTKNNGKYIYILVVIDSTTTQRVKHYVKEELAINLIKHCGIKLFETINQQVTEV